MNPERYEALVVAEKEAQLFRDLIRNKAKKYDAISCAEVQFLAELFGLKEEPKDKEEGEKENG